eukprot:170044-Amphidinium_carterae.1
MAANARIKAKNKQTRFRAKATKLIWKTARGWNFSITLVVFANLLSALLQYTKFYFITAPDEMITYYIPKTCMSGTVSVTVMEVIPPEFVSILFEAKTPGNGNG